MLPTFCLLFNVTIIAFSNHKQNKYLGSWKKQWTLTEVRIITKQLVFEIVFGISAYKEFSLLKLITLV